MWRRIAAMLVVLSLWGRVALAEGHYGNDAGYGFLSVIANVFYMPAKLVYAIVGGVTGGLAYVCTVGNFETAQSVWSPSLGGTYVITPAMLRSDEPILFSGVS